MKNGGGIKETAKHLNETHELRCPECGKLLMKGNFSSGTYIDVRCPNNRCKHHKKSLILVFE